MRDVPEWRTCQRSKMSLLHMADRQSASRYNLLQRSNRVSPLFLPCSIFIHAYIHTFLHTNMYTGTARLCHGFPMGQHGAVLYCTTGHFFCECCTCHVDRNHCESVAGHSFVRTFLYAAQGTYNSSFKFVSRQNSHSILDYWAFGRVVRTRATTCNNSNINTSHARVPSTLRQALRSALVQRAHIALTCIAMPGSSSRTIPRFNVLVIYAGSNHENPVKSSKYATFGSVSTKVSGHDKLCFLFNGRTYSGSTTLNEAGVIDGSVLIVISSSAS